MKTTKRRAASVPSGKTLAKNIKVGDTILIGGIEYHVRHASTPRKNRRGRIFYVVSFLVESAPHGIETMDYTTTTPVEIKA